MSIFPTRILLATDGSPDEALALETAVDIANATNSELHVVTAARGEPAYDIRIEEVAEQLRQEAQAALARSGPQDHVCRPRAGLGTYRRPR